MPLSGEGQARVRLGRYLERERAVRGDGREGGRESGNESDSGDEDESEDLGREAARAMWEGTLGIGAALRRGVVGWILGVSFWVIDVFLRCVCV